MATNNNTNCTCTTPEYTIILNQQGPSGRQGATGQNGFSPIIDVSTNTRDTYKLTITTADGVITTPNLKSEPIPSGGSEGQVLTNYGNDVYGWGNLPNATTTNQGVVFLSTNEDFQPDEEGNVDDTTACTPQTVVDYVKSVGLPIATTTTLGGVKPDGTTITVDPDGTIRGTETYVLPTASTTTLGGVKVDGTTITIDENGVIKSAGGSSLKNIQDITNGVAIGDVSTPIPSAGDYYKNTIQLTAEPNSSSWNAFNLTINSAQYTNGIFNGIATKKILTEYNGIVFVKLTEQEYADLPNKISTTMYITTDTNKVYLGTIELTGGGGNVQQSTFVNYPESSIVEMNTLKSDTQITAGYPDAMKIVIKDSTSSYYNINILYPGSSLPNANGTGYTQSSSYNYNINLYRGTATGTTLATALLYYYNTSVYYTDSLENLISYVSGFDASQAIYIGSGYVANGNLQQLISVPEYVINNFVGG